MGRHHGPAWSEESRIFATLAWSMMSSTPVAMSWCLSKSNSRLREQPRAARDRAVNRGPKPRAPGSALPRRFVWGAQPRSSLTILVSGTSWFKVPERAARGCCRYGGGASDRPATYRDGAKTRSSLRAAQAAPNPLSMLTVTTPGAQEASALCNAVVPPVATP